METSTQPVTDEQEVEQTEDELSAEQQRMDAIFRDKLHVADESATAERITPDQMNMLRSLHHQNGLTPPTDDDMQKLSKWEAAEVITALLNNPAQVRASVARVSGK